MDIAGGGRSVRTHVGIAESHVPFILNYSLNDTYAERAARGGLRNLHIFDHQSRRDLRRLPPDQRSRSLGSRASRSGSPNRRKPKTVSAIARPGKTAIHGAVEAYSSAPPCSIRPQAGTGSCTPRPR